jgi:hypothetical protein
MKTSAILREAAAAILKYGWIQGGFGGPREGFCVIGAINFVRASLAEHDLAMRAFREHLGILVIGSWNDRPERTKEQVIEKLLSAADKLEEQSL